MLPQQRILIIEDFDHRRGGAGDTKVAGCYDACCQNFFSDQTWVPAFTSFAIALFYCLSAVKGWLL